MMMMQVRFCIVSLFNGLNEMMLVWNPHLTRGFDGMGWGFLCSKGTR